MSIYTLYLQIKQQQPDALLFVRIGDFYHAFGSDAVQAAGILTLRIQRIGEQQSTGFIWWRQGEVVEALNQAGYRVICADSLKEA